jgi:putative transposase
MPRQPRLNLPGLFYHVMARGIERRPIFRQPRDYYNFLDRLKKLLPISGCRCFALALMPNHVHLLLLSGLRGLNGLMHRLLTGYAVSFNLKYDRTGYLFQNRYKSIVCQEDPYFKQLLRYIVLNPVRAGIVKSPDELAEYPWTSHSVIMGRRTFDGLEADTVLDRFGETRDVAREAYMRFIFDGWNQGYQPRFEGALLPCISSTRVDSSEASTADSAAIADNRLLGDEQFIQSILSQSASDEKRREQWVEKCSKERLLQLVSRWAKLPSEVILSSARRYDVSRARSILTHLAIDEFGQQGTDVAQWIGLSKSGISRLRLRGESLAKDADVKGWLEQQLGNANGDGVE